MDEFGVFVFGGFVSSPGSPSRSGGQDRA